MDCEPQSKPSHLWLQLLSPMFKGGDESRGAKIIAHDSVCMYVYVYVCVCVRAENVRPLWLVFGIDGGWRRRFVEVGWVVCSACLLL